MAGISLKVAMSTGHLQRPNYPPTLCVIIVVRLSDLLCYYSMYSCGDLFPISHTQYPSKPLSFSNNGCNVQCVQGLQGILDVSLGTA